MAVAFMICFCICFVGSYASSIGSSLESSLQCSKFHFEEKVLEKLVRLEHKIEIWEGSIPTNLDKMNDARKQTEIFLESMRDLHHQEQIRLNDSFQETVENIYLKSESKVKSALDSFSTKMGEFGNRSENALRILQSTMLQEQERFNKSFQETVENIKTQSESNVNSILDSILSKIDEFSESHSKRENAMELLQSNFLQEQERFNLSFHLMMDTIKEDLNKTTRNFISEQTDGRELPQECTDMSDVIPGICTVSPDKIHKLKVRCEDGTWTVIQKRFSGETEFYRNWTDYENGFGDLDGEFWLGNRQIALLTSIGAHELRITLEDWNWNNRHANYKNFKIDGASEKYRLHISGYSGNAGDGMAKYNGIPFSTYDRDHDTYSVNCAAHERLKGGWWYTDCWSPIGASLNGKYTPGASLYGGIIYRTWQSESLKKSTMMIRKA
ncbi:Fibrinogen-like protein A,Ryncolin-2,Tenascin-X,Angiopoietin-related protein 6,Angiopoietin-related protein 2,Ryncolin-1,Ryncolin-3,Fibrinogen C domain-containing protein 1 [Mytilus coruscus]|uniref:Fibrinogen-like protein A,Ryncolin-2,Tenascin-X,Angiopoietin-related protein 6,Angiopoietin-related protein 2,Ryncolin-1,Ryncolin-3,Fibrinogen C domain-containing protein 1 n=1 Tax=Mytilus coruscus TaxID=42192 RepID=A0A6J8CMY5_MYTCO|nr:Fibrinogen-like protein A,Ryncolin-2,Tenascin-X,Angiopoietin-related protein 6,Angiopoietin-related protein 2,Ryncolin-1,Ryncolin-3,Fibrinogen C domain-containing protein 1 [Mytilus coruscus]